MRPRRLAINTVVVLAVFSFIAAPLSGIATYSNLGFTESFYRDWVGSFAKSVVVMLPASLVLMIIVEKVVNLFVPDLAPSRKNLLIGIMIGVLMQLVVTAVTAANNIGLVPVPQFTNAWLLGFITALPLGLVISIVMTTLIKPRLERFMARDN